MNRSSIVALVIFAAVVGYFLSFGPELCRYLEPVLRKGEIS